MGEERKSVLGLDLSLKEIDGLLSDPDAGAGWSVAAQNMLENKRESILENFRREVRDSKDPGDAIKAILEIPEEEKLGVEMIDLGEVSVRILFARATKCLSTYEVELVGKVLMRMYPNGKGLGDEPWKTMFLANAKKSFPDDVEKMIEAVTEAGIDEKDYIDEVLRDMLLNLTYNVSQGDLTRAILSHKNLLSNISDFYGIDSLDFGEKKRLLKAGDASLAESYRAFKGCGFEYITKAVETYRWLRNNKVIEIGDRIKIVETYDLCEFDRISKRAMNARIRGIAKRLKII